MARKKLYGAAKAAHDKKMARKAGRKHTKTTRKPAKTARKSAARKHAPAKRAKKSGTRRAKRAVVVTQRRRAKGPVVVKTNRQVRVVKVPGRTRVVKVAAETYRRRHHRRHHHRRGAMENPLGAGEMIVGGITGLLGFLGADMLDRTLATHALTDTGKADGNGYKIFTDPGDQSTGSYKGLYNAAAVLAPMNVTRWAAGLGLAAVPMIAARFIKAPVGRAALQFFGFGVGIRVIGKGLVDITSMLLKKTSTAQRLYDAELRAQLAQNTAQGGKATYPTLPTAGLGAAHGFGCGCRRCGGGGGMQPSAPSVPSAPATPPPAMTSPPAQTGNIPPAQQQVAPPPGTPFIPPAINVPGDGGGRGGGTPSSFIPNAPLIAPRTAPQTLEGRPHVAAPGSSRYIPPRMPPRRAA